MGEIIYNDIPIRTKEDDLNRTKSILRLEPDLFTDKYKSVLYIGAVPPEVNNQQHNPYAGMAYLNEFKEAGYRIVIVEAHLPNYEILTGKHQGKFNRLYHGRIEDFRPHRYRKYDVVFWWHGPEHVEEERLPGILQHLEKFCNYIIITGCPWGRYKLGAVLHNPYEKHRSYLYPELFINAGYDMVDCVGQIDVPGSNMAAIKRVG